MTHQDFMREAIRLSQQGMDSNQGGPFGAIIVKGDTIIGRGNNRVTSSNDPTAHGEVNAIREACQTISNFNLSGCVIYTSCEPCPMCLSAIYWARLDEIYYANCASDAANIGFDDRLFYSEIAKPLQQRNIPMTNLLRNEALTVFKAWENKTDKSRY